jgi:hypothetical protein
MAKEQNIDDAIGADFINGEWVPIFELTPEMEEEIWRGNAIGPEGLTVVHSAPESKP